MMIIKGATTGAATSYDFSSDPTNTLRAAAEFPRWAQEEVEDQMEFDKVARCAFQQLFRTPILSALLVTTTPQFTI